MCHPVSSRNLKTVTTAHTQSQCHCGRVAHGLSNTETIHNLANSVWTRVSRGLSHELGKGIFEHFVMTNDHQRLTKRGPVSLEHGSIA